MAQKEICILFRCMVWKGHSVLQLFSLLLFVGGAMVEEDGHSSASPVTVQIKLYSSMSRVPLWFRGFTTDWWRANEARNKNGEKWGSAGMLTLKLTSRRLQLLTKALSPAAWRIGGSHQDSVVYVVGDPPACPPDKITSSRLSPGPICLTMGRWDEITHFATAMGLQLVFGLNGMYGRQSMEGPLNSTNIFEFLRYTAQKKIRVHAFELSNEQLKKRRGATAKSLSQDFMKLQKSINQLWPDQYTRPLLAGPDNQPTELMGAFLRAGDCSMLDAVSYHSYCNTYTTCDEAMLNAKRLQCSNDAIRTLDLVRSAYSSVKSADRKCPHPPAVWAGEVGPHNRGGIAGCTDCFINSFWYLDQLGSLAKLGIQLFLRSTLVGGDYGLLDKNTFLPRPDYFAALLWGHLMGQDHLQIELSRPLSSFLRLFASNKTFPSGETHLTLLFLNLCHQSTKIDVKFELREGDFGDFNVRKEYHVRAQDDGRGLFSAHAEFWHSTNGWTVLQLGENDELPSLKPIRRSPRKLLTLHPNSYAFVTYHRKSNSQHKRSMPASEVTLHTYASYLATISSRQALVLFCLSLAACYFVSKKRRCQVCCGCIARQNLITPG